MVIADTFTNLSCYMSHVQETSEILSLSTVFLQPVELVTTLHDVKQGAHNTRASK